MLKESVITFVSRLITVMLGTANVIILARFLGPKGQGIFMVIATLVTLLVAVGSLGIGQANVYFLGLKRYNIKELFWNSIFASFIVGVLLIGIALLTYKYLNPFFKGASYDMVALYALSIPLLLGWGKMNSFLLALQRFTSFNIIIITIGSLTAVNYIIFLSISPTIKTAIIISIIMNGVGFILTIIYMIKEIGLSIFKPKGNLKALLDSLKFGIKGHAGSVIDFMNFRIDRLLINLLAGPAAVGFYAIATTVAEAIWNISRSIALVLFPKVSNSSDIVSNAQTTAKSCRISFFSSIIIGIFLLLTGKWLIPLVFGSAFIASVPALNFLLPGVIIFSLTHIIISYMVGQGYPHYNTIIALISFIFNISLNLWLIPIMGIAGAAIASSVSYTISTISSIYLYKKIVKQKSKQSNKEINISLSDIIIIKQTDWKSIRNIFKQFGI